MTRGAPSFEEIFEVMATTSIGETATRVPVPDDPDLEHTATRFAIALNLLLDDLAYRTAIQTEIRDELEATLDSIGDAVIATDLEGRVVRMNSVAERLTGWSAAEAIGRELGDVFDIVNEDTREPVESPVDRVLEKGVVVGLANHTVLISRDGIERGIADSSAPIRDTKGRMHGVVLVFRDQTAEREAHRALRESEAQKSAVMAAALDAIVVMDHEGDIVDFNPAAEVTFGFRRREVIGKKLADAIVPPSLRGRHTRGLERYLETREPRVLDRRVEVPALRSDGTEFPAEVAVVRIRTDGPPQFTGYIRDITDRREAARAEAFRVARDAAEEANRELESFSYSVSHDLRAPLRAIGGFSRLLAGDYTAVLDDPGKHYLARILDNVRKMSTLIDDLLELSRIVRASIERETVDLSQLARAAVEALEACDPNRVVTVHVDDDLRANADARLLAVVLDNLIGNAWKFTAKVARPEIRVGRQRLDGEDVFYVRDNGAGFDMAFAEKLFGAFQRLHKESEFEGTGIGLATVHRVVTRHGGRIWAEAAVDRGATFYFTVGDSVDP